MRQTHRQPRAFVLLWTLALLALAAVVLTGLVRRSARHAVEAVEAQDQLQRKWAMASTRKLLLEHAEALLAHAEEQGRQPMSTLWLDGALGDAQVQVRVADEQAKVNVNLLYGAVGAMQTASQLRQMIKDPSGLARVDLHPDPRVQPQHRADAGPTTAPTTAPSVIQPFFRCWSQVFTPDIPTLLFQRVSDSPTDEFTCWGNGQLSLRRASDAALLAVLKPRLSTAAAQNLIRARAQNRSDSADHWMAAAALNPQDRKALTQATTMISSCYSASIHLRIGQRDWYELAVREIGDASQNNSQPTTQSSESDPKQERIYRLVW
jgi:hypothetical protein